MVGPSCSLATQPSMLLLKGADQEDCSLWDTCHQTRYGLSLPIRKQSVGQRKGRPQVWPGLTLLPGAVLDELVQGVKDEPLV